MLSSNLRAGDQEGFYFRGESFYIQRYRFIIGNIWQSGEIKDASKQGEVLQRRQLIAGTCFRLLLYVLSRNQSNKISIRNKIFFSGAHELPPGSGQQPHHLSLPGLPGSPGRTPQQPSTASALRLILMRIIKEANSRPKVIFSDGRTVMLRIKK